MTKEKNNYVNNKALYSALVHYRSEVQKAEHENKTKPVAPDYIGKAILLICENLAKKSNFSGYTYKEEMISDAIIDCVMAVDNFDPDKSKYPFAYFTQIAWFAFLRRIEKEKKQAYVKHKNYENSFLMNQLWEGESSMQLGSNEYSAEMVKSYEKKLTKNKKSNKITGIEKFSVEEEKNEK